MRIHEIIGLIEDEPPSPQPLNSVLGTPLTGHAPNDMMAPPLPNSAQPAFQHQSMLRQQYPSDLPPDRTGSAPAYAHQRMLRQQYPPNLPPDPNSPSALTQTGAPPAVPMSNRPPGT
jgi:hypothetical protein